VNDLPTVFSIDDLRRWDHHPQSRPTGVALAVLGDPVAHSASPPMHNAALKHYQSPLKYVRLHVRPDELAEAVVLLKRLQFLGVNLTIPHKKAVIPLIDQIDDHARKLGAVNTLAFREGLVVGFNTDGPGLVRAIQHDFKTSLRSCRVLITGAGGGAGRAAAIQCTLEGCPSITLVNRTVSKAEELAAELRSFQPFSPDAASRVRCLEEGSPEITTALQQVDLVLQCSSLGMEPNSPSPLPDSALHPKLMVYDTIYSRKTQLLLDAEKHGARGSNGLSMLLHQGALAFEIWFNCQAPVDAMAAALKASADC
jgi:shikimate dehydrogenase